MKKVLALVLVFMMVAVAGMACAETLDFTPGSPTACTVEDFQLYYSFLAENSGYSFVWEENTVKEDAWDVYTAQLSDGSMQVKIYCTDGNVVYVVSEGSITSDMSDTAAGERFGQWFGVAMMNTCATLCMGENGNDALNEEVSSRMLTDFSTLFTALESKITSEEDLVKSPALAATMLDYPTGLEMSGNINGATINLTIRIVTASRDSTLTVR